MQLNVSPKAGMIYYGVVAALGALLGCGAQFTTLFGAGPAQKVIAGVSIAFIALGPIGALLNAGASTKPGPLAPPDAPQAPRPANSGAAGGPRLAAGLLLAAATLLAPGGHRALAASRNPLQPLLDFILTDLPSAIALPQTAGIRDPNGVACWKTLEQVSPVVKAHPLLLTGRAASDLEAQRLILIVGHQVCENPACQQVFSEHVALLSRLALGVSPAVTLSSVCSYLPPIAVPTPTASPAASVAPAGN